MNTSQMGTYNMEKCIQIDDIPLFLSTAIVHKGKMGKEMAEQCQT